MPDLPPATPPQPSARSGPEIPQTSPPSDPKEPALSAQEHPAPMLDVHPAHHAATTWRDFFVHIATIVLGLLIAIGLEQTVEYFHHRHQIAETRELLRNEREDNKQAIVRATKTFRVVSAELQNNLQVLAYLQQHPGTPDEKLPGSLMWIFGGPVYEDSAWEAAQGSGVTSLMPREEIAEHAKLYAQLRKIDSSNNATWLAITDAERYRLSNQRLSDLTPAQISEITTLTQIALTKHFINGFDLQNLSGNFKDFPASLAATELFQLHHDPTQAELMQNPAYLVTLSRLKEAGYIENPEKK